MSWRVYAVIACTWFLLSFVAHCQTCGNSECQDASDEAVKVGHALLQKQTKTHAVTTGEDTKCHEECKSPTCKAGAGWNGGFPLQRDGYCGQTCSRAFGGGIRYCGQGDSYTKGASIDCSGCRKTCPEDCKSASCFAGGSHNGGVPLVGGSCQNLCSRAWAGKRYCGTGSAYMQSDSLDCAACAQEGAPQTCSDKCKSPTCVDGGAHNGGVSLVKGKCTQHCSKDFHGRRFCGTGDAYTSGDSVDCTPCAKEEQGSQFYLAGDNMSFCPKIKYDGTSKTFSNHVENFDKCANITMIDGKAYTWSGSFGCHPYWPKAGCFVWGSALYFSTCQGPDLHSISQHEHYGVCEMAS